MPEATIDENGVIECGAWSFNGQALLYVGKSIYPTDADLDDLYAVLHARHMAQAYDKTYLDKIQKIADRMLYKGEPNEVLD